MNGDFPTSDSIAVWTAGIRVEPPTRITLSTSPLPIPASFIALLVGAIVFSTNLEVKSSNLALESERSRCSGCPSFMVIKGKLI